MSKSRSDLWRFPNCKLEHVKGSPLRLNALYCKRTLQSSLFAYSLMYHYLLPFDIGYVRITSMHRAEQHQNGAFISDIDGFNLHSILDASHRGPKFDRRQTQATIGKKSYVRYHSWHGFMGLKALAMQGRCMQQLTRVSLKQKKIEKLQCLLSRRSISGCAEHSLDD